MERFRLPKAHLLRKSREFDRVYRQGRRLRGHGMQIIFRPNDLPYNRLGISVHRKTGGAVRRNRIKRIIRESFRCNRDLYPSNSDIVITVRPDFGLDSAHDVTSTVAAMMASGKARK
ncbi:ribonuclease P protein component [Desulfolithobacter sp.]